MIPTYNELTNSACKEQECINNLNRDYKKLHIILNMLEQLQCIEFDLCEEICEKLEDYYSSNISEATLLYHAILSRRKKQYGD